MYKIIHNKEILERRLMYKYYFLNNYDMSFNLNLNMNLNIKDDVNLYNIYYFLEKILYKKPSMIKVTNTILGGGLNQDLIKINVLLNEDVYVYNFLKIIYVYLLNKFIRKEFIIKYLNEKDIILNILINDLKKLNLRENLNKIKSIIEIKLNNINKINNYFIFFFFKLLGIF